MNHVLSAYVGPALSMMLLCATSARAQVTTITPSVTMGVGRDDNVFWLPTSVSDRFWPVTPALTIGVESPQSAWLGTYTCRPIKLEVPWPCSF